ncbi:MAG: sigma-54-dependent Fis family transcriptional regulator [Candidatus Omnitrophica bacterium]|nr:sigma-54-dependent Fis family transcriptional regulator [Candidatus Omnitrophota bacterium]
MGSQLKSILVVDDEESVQKSMDIILGRDYQILKANDPKQALHILETNPVDLVFLDLTFPSDDHDGFWLLEKIQGLSEKIDVIMLSATDQAKTAVKALKMGAYDYLAKPYEAEEIQLLVKRALEKKQLQTQLDYLEEEQNRNTQFEDIVGHDPKMRIIFDQIRKAAAVESTVLITGETGTGKELVARAIRSIGPYKDKPFVAINCGAIPDNLMESELFGHEKGSFTGAHERRIGKFEIANNGIIFLDEISCMEERLQVKLLRVLQEKEFERVGSTKTFQINIRVIAATNSDFQDLIRKNKFREDLYYRLNVIHIHLPPLRERTDDIPVLAQHFLRQFAAQFSRNISGFDNDALEVLKNYAWPGNVREIKNVIERTVVLADGPVIRKRDLPMDLALFHAEIQSSTVNFSLKSEMEKFEKNLILNLLERNKWHQTKVAEILGIHRNTLLVKLQSLGIKVQELKSEGQ